MATIEDVIANAPFPDSDASKLLKKNPAWIAEVFKPLIDVGFKDFTLLGNGTSSFCVAPTDNNDFVIRVTVEQIRRRDDIPFFLANAYEKYFSFSPKDKLHLELLLAGNTQLSPANQEFLLDEMKAAGWRMHKVEKLKLFFRDVVAIPFRRADGRVVQAPIISDPSALPCWLDSAYPVSEETGDGQLKPPNLNKCRGSYPSLAEQAAAYNAVIERDPRLKKLVPEPVQFPATEIMGTATELQRHIRA